MRFSVQLESLPNSLDAIFRLQRLSVQHRAKSMMADGGLSKSHDSAKSRCSPPAAYLILPLVPLTRCPSRARPLDLALNSPIQRRPFAGARRLLVALPLLRRLTLCTPSMDLSNFILQRRVDQPMPLEGRLARELRRDDQRAEGLAAAACARKSAVSLGEGWYLSRMSYRTCL
jgi:hypothetical protein